MAVNPSSLSWTYTGAKSGTGIAGTISRLIKVTVPGQTSVTPTQVNEIAISGGEGYNSGNPMVDQMIQAIDAQVLNGTTSGTITVTIT